MVACFFSSSADATEGALGDEVYALKAGIQLGWDLGYRNLIYEVDCGELVNLLQNRSQIQFHRLRNFLLDICDLLDRDWTIVVNQISREANSVADWLAKYGATHSSVLTVLDNPPLKVEAFLLGDMPNVG